ncbi:MAG: glycosyltransferase family 2 protein [Pirellulaceae bacterium]|nr:glycosyltransferase family 2 protein [Pirellulaceae bacterium]
MMEPLTIGACVCAMGSAILFVVNLVLFRKAGGKVVALDSRPTVSVLIPARNEVDRISRTLDAVLANLDVELEVIVLDDHSDDGTDRAVIQIAAHDERVRLVQGKPLPAGWCGKQYACQQLATQASHEHLLFLDADVHLTPDAICRAVAQYQRVGVALLSGFPKQQVESLGEALLIPLMHIVLLTYLPFVLMRRTLMKGASAGCGQFFLTTKSAYERVGGHATVKASLHDGVQLPRQFRQARLKTDVFDASDIASCRMYHGWQQTWNGLEKNAYEGIANERLIVPFTVLMVLGYVAPTVVGLMGLFSSEAIPPMAMIGMAASYLPRVLAAFRFDRAWFSTCLFPLAIVLFLVLQWWALLNHYWGTQATWRGRAYPAASA